VDREGADVEPALAVGAQEVRVVGQPDGELVLSATATEAPSEHAVSTADA